MTVAIGSSIILKYMFGKSNILETTKSKKIIYQQDLIEALLSITEEEFSQEGVGKKLVWILCNCTIMPSEVKRTTTQYVQSLRKEAGLESDN